MQVLSTCAQFTYLIIFILQEEFEDTKGVIRIPKSKNRQHNDQKKKDRKTNIDLENTTQIRLNRLLFLKIKLIFVSGIGYIHNIYLSLLFSIRVILLCTKVCNKNIDYLLYCVLRMFGITFIGNTKSKKI